MKKTIKILGIFICAGVLVFNMSVNGKSATGDTNLLKLLLANEADAECIPHEGWNNGFCVDLSGWCLPTPWPEDQVCDTGLGWPEW